MSLFEAPGWESGAPFVAAPTSTNRKSNKRKRAPGAITDEDAPAADVTNASTLTSTPPNLQKLMRKLRIEQERKNSTMERLKPSESVAKALKARKKSALPHIVTSMDPPQTSSPRTTEAMSPFAPSTLGQPAAKKPRIRREESDVLPPSSAGDETEPSQFLAEIKKKKRNKKSRRQISSEPVTKPTIETMSEPDSEDATERVGDQASGWKASENDSPSDEYAGLTKLQREMKQRLSGGRFRWAYHFAFSTPCD